MLSAVSFELGTSEMIMVFIAVLPLVILVPFTVIDSLRSPRLSVVQKVAWIIFILIAPYLGAVVYLLWGRKQKIV